MRLWSINFKYLDSIGLIALWREGLLAKNVLEGKTIGYKNHPQLERFKKQENPIFAINNYLYYVYAEAKSRNYNFNLNKITYFPEYTKKIKISYGQIKYEFNHLQKKLETRDNKKYHQNALSNDISTISDIFEIDKDNLEIESWEKI